MKHYFLENRAGLFYNGDFSRNEPWGPKSKALPFDFEEDAMRIRDHYPTLMARVVYCER